ERMDDDLEQVTVRLVDGTTEVWDAAEMLANDVLKVTKAATSERDGQPRSTISSRRDAGRISRRRSGSRRSRRRWRARAAPAHRARAGDGSAPGPTVAAQTPRSRSASAGQRRSTRWTGMARQRSRGVRRGYAGCRG